MGDASVVLEDIENRPRTFVTTFKEDIDRCIECGMNDHLAKPIDEKAVIEKNVHYALKRAG